MKHYNQSNIQLAAILLLALTTGFCYTTERITYSGYTLFRTYPQKEQHIAGLRVLRAQEYDGVEFWTEPSSLNTTVDIMVSPEQHDDFVEHLRHLRLPARKIMHDVGEVIKRTNHVQMRVGRMLGLNGDSTGKNVSVSDKYFSPDYYYLRYQSYSLIERKLQMMAKNPAVTLDVLGKSYEGRKLYLVKISTDPKAQKPVIFLDAGHHAREWISHSTIQYIMDSLIEEQVPTVGRHFSDKELFSVANSFTDNAAADDVDGNGEQPSVFGAPMSGAGLRSYLEKYDFWFIPVINPDGYEYSHSVDRIWRKTRSNHYNYPEYCRGVDPNRNYPMHWGGKGTSRRPCDETFAGPKPLSEPETKVLADTLLQNRDRIKMYVSLHAYSQVILMPYGHEKVLPKDYDEMSRVAKIGARGIYYLRGTQYRTGTSAILLYPAAGGSDDFAYENAGIKFSYTIELPDTGAYGFILPPKEIIPVGQETVSGLTAMIRAIGTS